MKDAKDKSKTLNRKKSILLTTLRIMLTEALSSSMSHRGVDVHASMTPSNLIETSLNMLLPSIRAV